MDNANRRWAASLAIVSILVLGAFCSGATNLEDIVPLIEKSAASAVGLTKEKVQIAQRVRNLGPRAVPYLLPLLKPYGNGEVRELTSYILRDMEGLTEEHLEALIESRRNGDVWIPPAIARVGTPKAIAFLVEDLKKEERSDTQLVAAFQILGERGVPYLVELLKTGPLDGGLPTAVTDIFGRLGDRAEPAVAPLTELVSSKQDGEEAVRCAVQCLGAIGPRARAAAPALLELAKDGPKSLTRAADRALAMMKAPEAVPGLLKRWEERPDDWTALVEIISLKENGRGAGPALVRHLRDDNLLTQVWAATTLGYIGYVEASPDLIRLLQADHWWLVYASVESLGRLHAVDAIGPLSEMAESYWHPAVHEAAIKAIQVISGKASYEPKDAPGALFGYMLAGASGRRGASGAAWPGSNRFYADEKDRLDREQLKKIADIMEGNASVPGKGGKNTEGRGEPDWWRLPNAGIKVDDGYLVGFDRGEFGGELVFVDLKGYRAVLLRDNVRGIHRMASDIVVVAGLSHLGMSHGAVYKVSRGKDGTWGIATKWIVLPDAPVVSGVRPNGNLFVACYGEKVEISPSGDVKTVTR